MPPVNFDLRRNWRLVGALAALAVFTAIHFLFYRPAAARYQAALASVGGIGAVFRSGSQHAPIPPRTFALITNNTLKSHDAEERGSSGELGVLFLEDLGRLAVRAGLTVISSEPQAVSQDKLATMVRAHVVLRGTYSEAASFLGSLSDSGELITVDSFEITASPGSQDVLDLGVSRVYLKQVEPTQ